MVDALETFRVMSNFVSDGRDTLTGGFQVPYELPLWGLVRTFQSCRPNLLQSGVRIGDMIAYLKNVARLGAHLRAASHYLSMVSFIRASQQNLSTFARRSIISSM